MMPAKDPDDSADRAARRRALERLAYGATSSPDERQAAHEQLAASNEQAVPEATEQNVGLGATASAGRSPAPSDSNPALARPQRRVSSAFLVGGGIVVGAAATLGVIGIGNPMTDAPLVPGRAASAMPAASGQDNYALLDVAQSDADIPPLQDLEEFSTLSDLRAETLRRLPMGTPDIPHPLNSAYIGRDHSSRICVAMVNLDGSFVKSCSASSERPAEPLSVSWSTSESFADLENPVDASIGLRLGVDGTMSWTVSRIYAADDRGTRIVDFDQH